MDVYTQNRAILLIQADNALSKGFNRVAAARLRAVARMDSDNGTGTYEENISQYKEQYKSLRNIL